MCLLTSKSIIQNFSLNVALFKLREPAEVHQGIQNYIASEIT